MIRRRPRRRLSGRLHFSLAYGLLGLATAAIVAGTTLTLARLGGDRHPECSQRIPSVAPDASPEEVEEAAVETAALFVRTTVMRNSSVRGARSYGEPVCGWYLVSEQIKRADPAEDEPEEWVDGEIPVSPYPTREPVATDAKLAPRSATLVRRNRRGVDELTGLVLLDAPDLPQGVFQIALELREDRWLVSYWGSAILLAAPRATIELQ